MLRSPYPAFTKILLLWLVTVVVIAAPRALGQDFTLQASPMSPGAVDPGGSSISTITVSAINTTSPVTVSLSCAITSGPTGTPPGCQVSPTSVTTPASPTMTVTTTGTTVPGLYTITVTGSDASGTIPVPVTLNVIAVVPQYSLSITSPLNPTSVHAGNGATAVVSIIPADGYGGQSIDVTLACSSVTPVVSLSPFCSFTYGNNQPETPNGVPVPTSAPVPVTLTITTYPLTITPAASSHAMLYVPGLPLAAVALFAGFGTRKRRFRRLFALALLFTVAMAVLLLPGCGTTVSGVAQTTTTNSTPHNTYVFTLTAIDNQSPPQAASNATDVTVSLTVD
jgi:hypothetical protein